MAETEWLTIAQACDVLKVSERTLRRRIDQGKIHSKLEHGRRMVNLAEPTRNIDRNGGQNGHALTDHLKTEVAHLRDIVDKLTAELTETRHSAEESSQRHDTIVMQMTQQLERAQLQLEDFRRRPTIWQRIREVFAESVN